MREFPKPLQVYVVEDSAILRRVLASAIEAAGGVLMGSSPDAESAIAELCGLRPDLVLIDIALKSGTGFDVLEALQKLDPRPAPIKVVLTNHAYDEYRHMSAQLGANAFFDKTTETSQVLALIGALSGERRGAWHSASVADRPKSEKRR
jgi:CheY-like chemotaxis protein